jgi:hypothetical protein
VWVWHRKDLLMHLAVVHGALPEVQGASHGWQSNMLRGSVCVES